MMLKLLYKNTFLFLLLVFFLSACSYKEKKQPQTTDLEPFDTASGIVSEFSIDTLKNDSSSIDSLKKENTLSTIPDKQYKRITLFKANLQGAEVKTHTIKVPSNGKYLIKLQSLKEGQKGDYLKAALVIDGIRGESFLEQQVIELEKGTHQIHIFGLVQVLRENFLIDYELAVYKVPIK